MRTILRISVFTLTILFFYSCKKDKPTIPTITTRAVSDISTTSAVSGGDITNEGGATLISKGICWNISPDPTLDHNKTSESGGSVSFSSNISQLSPNTTYYVRAYAINIAGTGYGESVSFKTLGDKPASNSINASNIQTNSATLNGTVNPNSLSTVVTFEYGTTTSYGSTITAAQSPITGNTAANISTDLTGLIPGTVYHFRIKAENSLGITFSADLTMTTLGLAPSVTAQTATGLQLNTATLNGTVNPNLVSTTATFEWGLTTSYGSTATAIQSPVTGSTIVNISANLTGLAPGTTYHFRIKGENSVGVTCSNDLTFTTLGQVPAALTQAATNLQINSSTLNGTVNANYLSTTAVFEWGTTTSYGSTATAVQSPVTGNTPQAISANLSGLSPGTTYHFRIKAENLLGISYSTDLTFTTLGKVPDAISQVATGVEINSATINGSVNANYLSTTTSFEWGTTNGYGNTAIPLQNQVNGNDVTSISVSINGLNAETTYHFRITATNELGTTTGEDRTFRTYSAKDADHNFYHSVSIGTQTWLSENLKTTKYQNGDEISTTIPAVLDISGESTPKYLWAYNGNELNALIYGRLYTWYAVTDERKVCPAGWHLPSDDEWTTLTGYLGGESIAGGKLKEIGTGHWFDYNNGATNEFGFNALPGGYRLYSGSVFNGINFYAAWWSSTTDNANLLNSWNRDIGNSQIDLRRGSWPKKTGFSVRCMKD